ncbi:MAG: ABC transporter substrate-binding protein [Thaumarchaeota archaeon]|nr:ABC transporter substrate-binding protein [Nitrososphaerota archaeon]
MHRTGISTSGAVGLLIIGLLIGAAVTYVAVPPSSTVSTTTVSGGSTSTKTVTVSGGGGGTATTTINGQLSGTVPIGVLTDLSDGLSGEGLRVNTSTIMAVQDINAYLSSIGRGDLQFQAVIGDYHLDTPTALNLMKTWEGQGVSVVVGPLNSGTAGGLLDEANSHHIVMISPSSTAPTLGIPNDYLYRLPTNDTIQAQADARMPYTQGVRDLIIVYRQDSYGSALANGTAADFAALGGNSTLISYPQDATDFTSTLTAMNDAWAAATATFPPDQVAFDVIAFEEIGNMLVQANAQPGFQPLLNTTQPWYSTDGPANDPVLTANDTVGPLMAQVRILATLWGGSPNTPKLQDFCSRFVDQIHQPSTACDSYTLEAYDSVWVGALAILACNASDGQCVQSVLPSIASNYFGVTGWTELNSAGDRAPAPYVIWTVLNEGGTPTWELAGTWDNVADIVTWNPGYPQ